MEEEEDGIGIPAQSIGFETKQMRPLIVDLPLTSYVALTKVVNFSQPHFITC